eukprot:3110966-Ditylum_brightwellii.AAC.1
MDENDLYLWVALWVLMTLNPAYKFDDFFSIEPRDALFTCPTLDYLCLIEDLRPYLQQWRPQKNSPLLLIGTSFGKFVR